MSAQNPTMRIVVYIKQDKVLDIERLAKKANRTRSNQILHFLDLQLEKNEELLEILRED